MNPDVKLREMEHDDLNIFFEQYQNPKAQHMAAFISEEPGNRIEYVKHWTKLMSDDNIIIRTITYNEEVAGHIIKFIMNDNPEITYWIGEEFWGKGIASTALDLFLDELEVRPLFARVAKDNKGSIKVLERNGFTISGYDRGFANARGKEIEEVILELN